MREAQYEIIEDTYLQDIPLVIKDIGPWTNHLTITNGAEGVVQRLVQPEILVRDGFFAGFAPYNKTASPAATSEAVPIIRWHTD